MHNIQLQWSVCGLCAMTVFSLFRIVVVLKVDQHFLDSWNKLICIFDTWDNCLESCILYYSIQLSKKCASKGCNRSVRYQSCYTLYQRMCAVRTISLMFFSFYNSFVPYSDRLSWKKCQTYFSTNQSNQILFVMHVLKLSTNNLYLQMKIWHEILKERFNLKCVT